MKCDECGDTGIIFVNCCSGYLCGCLGQPTQAKSCKCGQDVNEENMSKYEQLAFRHVEFIQTKNN